MRRSDLSVLHQNYVEWSITSFPPIFSFSPIDTHHPLSYMEHSGGGHDSHDTNGRQRLVVASQALEIQHLQDTLRSRERELSERDAWHAKQADEQAKHISSLQHKNEALDRDVLLLSNKLRGMESEEEVHASEEVQYMNHAAHSSREKDALIKQLRKDVGQLRLELRTLADEKSVLLNKVITERNKVSSLESQLEEIEGDNLVIRDRCRGLERAKHDLLVKLHDAEHSGSSGDDSATERSESTMPRSHRRSYAPFRDEELRLPVSCGTQTTHEVLIPSVFDGAPPTRGNGPAKMQVEGLRYLVEIEQGRVAFHKDALDVHQQNVKRLHSVIKDRIEGEMHRLRVEQSSLESLLESVGGSGVESPLAINDFEPSNLRSPSAPGRGGAPPGGPDSYAAQMARTPNGATGLNRSRVTPVRGQSTGTSYSAQLAADSSEYLVRQDHEMAGLRDRLKHLQSQHDAAANPSRTQSRSTGGSYSTPQTPPSGGGGGSAGAGSSSVLQRMLGKASTSDSRLRAL